MFMNFVTIAYMACLFLLLSGIVIGFLFAMVSKNLILYILEAIGKTKSQ